MVDLSRGIRGKGLSKVEEGRHPVGNPANTSSLFKMPLTTCSYSGHKCTAVSMVAFTAPLLSSIELDIFI